jgi:hypothetical protein
MADINAMLNSQTAAVQSVSSYASTLKAQEIRVVLLSPGQWDDEISCRLINSSLESPLEYEALSYVWAQEPGHRCIRLNGSRHQITTNLFLALRRLRKATEARYIWIDALCINQDNSKERNHQVALMGSIYKSCTRALLWLGDYESPTGSPRQTLTIEEAEAQSWEEISAEQISMQDKGFAAMNTVHELSVNKHLSATSMYEEVVKSDERNDLHHLRSFRSLLDLPWWTRIWTIQEAVLPPMATVLYGSFAVKWEVFETAEMCAYQHAATCCNDIWKMEGKDNFRFEFNNTVLRFGNTLGSLKVLRTTRRESNTDTTLPLHRILWNHRERKASEPHDLFYGLLGLPGMMVPSLMVDYRLPCEAVFKIATLLSIQQTGKLYIMQRRKNPQTQKPFWIYNFDTVVDIIVWDMERVLMVREQRFFTAAGISQSVAFWNDFEQDHLELKGIFCSKVVLAGHSFSGGSYTVRGLSSILIQWESLAKGFYSNRTPDTPYGRDWKSGFIRTLVSDLADDLEPQIEPRRVCAADLPIIRGVVAKAIRMEKPPTARLDSLLFHSMIGSLMNRAFFITADGYMGLGSPELGDEVWVLFGGDTPFILRPSVTDPGCHQLIGSCYVHGLMDGEAMVDVEAKQQTVSLC